MNNALKQQLLAMLSESEFSINTRVEAYLKDHFNESRPTVLFGAGNVGADVALRLTKIGHKPSCFMDDTPSKNGTYLVDVPILSREEVLVKYGSNCNLIVTILNPEHNFQETQMFFAEKGIKAMTFIGLSWFYSEVFHGMHGITHPTRLLAMKDEIMAFFDLLADDKSKSEYISQIKFRLMLDFDCLTPKEDGVYFPNDIPLIFNTYTTFLDAGAYDGDSIENAYSKMGAKLQKVIAFEPDPLNFIAMKKRLRSLGILQMCELHQAAIGAKEETLFFNATGDMSASFSKSGGVKVKVEALVNYITEEDMYLKFDIEGHEETAITAALPKIKAHKPQMAISVYHKPTDLWRIALMLHKAVPEYQFYTRNHGIDATDFICYVLLRK